ncbi:hypothetical protein E0K83_12480 [Gramella sp. BOM4]|nr:hypothetical protein [Christiangramia bathymodioli]
MAALEEIKQHFDIDELEKQLQTVLTLKDPIGYMESNINWEIDKEDLDDSPELDDQILLMTSDSRMKTMYGAWNPFKRFLSWLSRKKIAKGVKKALCGIADKIQGLIDEEAELKKILEVALLALIGALGIGSINPVVLTIVVGFLGAMILNGVTKFCGF